MIRTRDHDAVVRDAIDVLFVTVGRLPPSDRSDDLRARVTECARKANHWSVSAPTDRDGLLKCVLALHVDVAKLESEVLLADLDDQGA